MAKAYSRESSVDVSVVKVVAELNITGLFSVQGGPVDRHLALSDNVWHAGQTFYPRHDCQTCLLFDFCLVPRQGSDDMGHLHEGSDAWLDRYCERGRPSRYWQETDCCKNTLAAVITPTKEE